METSTGKEVRSRQTVSEKLYHVWCVQKHFHYLTLWRKVCQTQHKHPVWRPGRTWCLIDTYRQAQEDLEVLEQAPPVSHGKCWCKRGLFHGLELKQNAWVWWNGEAGLFLNTVDRFCIKSVIIIKLLQWQENPHSPNKKYCTRYAFLY